MLLVQGSALSPTGIQTAQTALEVDIGDDVTPHALAPPAFWSSPLILPLCSHMRNSTTRLLMRPGRIVHRPDGRARLQASCAAATGGVPPGAPVRLLGRA